MLGTEVCLILARMAGLSCQLHRLRLVLGNLAKLLCDCRLCYLRSHPGPEARQWHCGSHNVSRPAILQPRAGYSKCPLAAPRILFGPKSPFRHLNWWLQRVPLEHVLVKDKGDGHCDYCDQDLMSAESRRPLYEASNHAQGRGCIHFPCSFYVLIIHLLGITAHCSSRPRRMAHAVGLPLLPLSQPKGNKQASKQASEQASKRASA